MKLLKPKASKKSLEKLLAYLGTTENYSKHYKGNRAEDFKKCFDTESPWCWMYADLVLRGLEKRNAEPGDEGHHAVPRSFYGVRTYCSKIDAGNLFTLSYAEHVLVHYCACYCATGKNLGKMIRGFLTMYNMYVKGRKTIMPSEAELLDAIPEMELRRIRAMEPRWAKVEADGRTHYSEDPKQYRKEYQEANKEKIAEQQKAYREANREKLAERMKAWYEANKDRILEQRKANYETNKEKILESQKANYDANKDKIHEKQKSYREANKEKIALRGKYYRETNKEKIAERKKTHYEANKDKIHEKQKSYREANKEKIAEQRKAHYETNKEKILESQKAYRDANKEKIVEQRKARYEVMKSAGYRLRRDPVTGKRGWVFVGKPATPETPNTSMNAA
jgi:hypothetical protein